MKLRLLGKLLLFILLPVVLALSIAQTINYISARDALNEQIHTDLSMLSERQKSELSNIVSLLQGAARSLSETPRVHTVLKQSARTPQSVADANAALEETTRNFTLIKDAGIVDAEGTVVAHTQKQAIGTRRGDRSYFTASMRGEVAAENLVSRSTGALMTILSVPIKENGNPAGILYLMLDMGTLEKEIISTVRFGKTGISFVYSSSGTLLLHPNKQYVGDENGKLAWVQQILREKNGSLEYVWEGKEKLLYFKNIPAIDWFVVISAEKEELFRPVDAMLQRSILTGGIFILLVGLLIFLVARNVTKAINGGVGLVQHVASGNFRFSTEQQNGLDKDCTRGDEIGDLARCVREMVGNLAGLFEESREKTRMAEIAGQEAREATAQAEEARRAAEHARHEGMLSAAGQLEGVVSIVSSASTQLSSQIEQSERGAAEQAARVSETATAMDEMNSTVMEVAKNADTASRVSAKTREKATQGAEIVHKAVESIQQVQQESLALKTQMAELETHATSINQIMGVISDIADQTNLLALNAAIEAARAGEAGRGFAVVADEVRKLAEKTMLSTSDVGAAIKAIQNSADKSREQVDHAVQVIEKATGYAQQSGEALREILSMADDTADQVRTIATASEQQSASSEEISRSIAQVSSIAEQTTRSMSEASSAVHELAQQAGVLSDLIEKMKQG